MAEPNGPPTDHLIYLRQASQDAHRHGFFSLLRRAEALAKHLPRIGRSRTPAQNIVDLAHDPQLAFPARTIEAIEPGGPGRLRVRSLFLGLTGPMGALPIHLTEFAYYEGRGSGKRPFGRFLDVLTDRLLQFFYRAWADSQPAAQGDRPDDDAFAGYVGSLAGVGLKPSRKLGAADRTLTWRDYLRYAGALTGRRSASAIQDTLSHVLKTDVHITEYIPRWREIDRHERTRLGGHGFNCLGMDTVLGARVLTADDTFRVTLRARSIEDYLDLLPGRPRYEIAREVLEVVKPGEQSWEMQLELEEVAAPAARLDGTTPLGFASWVSPKAGGRMRADARIRGA
jgi:type VI secretion system protein ImpH